MSTIMPQSELQRRAITWISEQLREKGAKPLVKILDEAGMRFNLGPKDMEFLERFFKENHPEAEAD